MRRRDRRSRKPVTKTSRRLLPTALAFVVLLFAGASVSAWAGSEVDSLVGATEETVEVTTGATTTATEPAETEPTATEPAEPAAEPAARAQRVVKAYAARLRESRAAAARPSTVPSRDAQHEVVPAAPRQTAEPAERPAEPLLRARRSRAARPVDPEAQAAAASTIWLHRSLPDPTPPARRLSLDFAVQLALEAKRAGVSWSVVLAVLRVRGHSGPRPASVARLRSLSRRLAVLERASSREEALRALTGSSSLADEADALAHFNRAVGLYSLVTGLERAKPRLARLLLGDPRIDVYAGGREDVSSGSVDVRVIVLVRYLADVFGQASVSSLHSGHRLYARPGVVSAHVYGLAVDISAVGETAIAGHQEPGGITERAVRSILLLPAELQPQQVISLLGLGGPSFPLGDHADHIHVGY